jgi:hypothetical protein
MSDLPPQLFTQLPGLHGPQSAEQLVQFSPEFVSHFLSPQNGLTHGPQSAGQLVHDSPASLEHRPSPQRPGQGPQSMPQLLQFSPSMLSHLLLPQLAGQGPQSFGQEVHDSLPLQLPSPHVGWQGPQSIWQFLQVSPILGSQNRSPQVGGHLPQSWPQVLHDSLAPHTPSPHLSWHLPQSLAQFRQLSAPLHTPSPQTWPHGPQSLWQFWQFSPLSLLHLPSPHKGLGQVPQSPGQVAQVSPGLHKPSPQPFLAQKPFSHGALSGQSWKSTAVLPSLLQVAAYGPTHKCSPGLQLCAMHQLVAMLHFWPLAQSLSTLHAMGGCTSGTSASESALSVSTATVSSPPTPSPKMLVSPLASTPTFL